MDVVKEYGVCPLNSRTDCGTENGLVAEAQCYYSLATIWHIFMEPHLITDEQKGGGRT